MVGEQRWLVLATRTIIFETRATSGDEAIDIVSDEPMPETDPHLDPNEFDFDAIPMEGYVVYPDDDPPPQLSETDLRTVQIRRMKDLIEQFGRLGDRAATREARILLRQARDLLAAFRAHHHLADEEA